MTDRGTDAYVAMVVACATAVYLFYFFLLRLPPNADRFATEYPGWLLKIFKRSAAAVVRQPWIWAPALAFLVADIAYLIHWYHHISHSWEYTSQRLSEQFAHLLPVLESTGIAFCRNLGEVGAHTPAGVSFAWTLFYLACFLLSPFFGTLLRREGGLTPLRRRTWCAAFVIGSLAGILEEGTAAFHGSSRLLTHILAITFPLVDLARFPVLALMVGFYLTIMVRSVRREQTGNAEVLKSTLCAAGPLFLLYAIQPVINILLGCAAAVLALRHDHSLSSFTIWAMKLTKPLSDWKVASVPHLVMAWVSVVIVSEQCGLAQAFARLWGFFLRSRRQCAALLLFGALTLTLPSVLKLLMEYASLKCDIPILNLSAEFLYQVTGAAVGVILSVMCVWFYLADTGKVEARGAEL